MFPALPMKGLKAEFGYDDRIGVGACDRGPSGFGDEGKVASVQVGTVRTCMENIGMYRNLKFQYIPLARKQVQEPSPLALDGAHEMRRLQTSPKCN